MMMRNVKTVLLACLLLAPPVAQGFVSGKSGGLEKTEIGSLSTTTRPSSRRQVHTPLREEEETVVAAATSSASVALTTTPTTPKKDATAAALRVLMQRNKTLLLTILTISTSAAVTSQLALAAPLRLLRRNMLAGCVIFTVGDVGAQLWTAPPTGIRKWHSVASSWLDQKRLSIAMILGAVWAGLVNPAVYQWAEHLFPGSASMRRVLIKMVISCSILSTAGNYASMFLRRWLGGKPWRACMHSCNDDFMEVLRDDLKIWPLYDIMCYSLIPPVVRPISNAIMASLWSMYISIASAKQQQPSTTTSTTTTTDESVQDASILAASNPATLQEHQDTTRTSDQKKNDDLPVAPSTFLRSPAL